MIRKQSARSSLKQFVLAAFLMLVSTSLVDAAVLSTAQFVELYPRWQEFAKKKTRIIVEGRYGGRAGASIRVEKCDDVLFHAADGARLPSFTNRKANIEFSGYLKRTSGKYTFIVERHSIQKSDVERLLIKKRNLITDKPEQWYALGRKAIETAEFYGDEELQREAEAVLIEGIRREERSLKEDDIAGLRALAERIKSFKLDEGHRLELIHDALWIQWQVARKKKTPLEDFIKQVIKDLPGADQPLKEYNEKSRTAYTDSPSLGYRKATPAERTQLHRLFLMTIQLAEIERQAKPDGRNGYEIASMIEAAIPELKDLPTTYRRRELAKETKRIDRLSQAEMRQLARRYLDLGDGDEAKATVSNWVKSLETRFRTQGPSGLIKSADLYRDELRDRNKEAELLQEAWSQLSGSQLEGERNELEKRLNSLSWSRRGQRWVKGLTPDDRPGNQQPTGVQVGMTPEQVRKILNGSPTSRTRIAARDKTIELWVYRDAGLVVQLEHPAGGSATVMNVKGLR